MSATFWWKSIIKNAFLCKAGRDDQKVFHVEGTLDSSCHIHLKWKANGLEVHGRLAGRGLLRDVEPQCWVSSGLDALQSLGQRKEWLVFHSLVQNEGKPVNRFTWKLVLILQRIPKKIQYAIWNQKNWSRTKELVRGWSWGDPSVLWLTKAKLPCPGAWTPVYKNS